MSEYNQYVTAINKIYDILAKMKTGWNSLDNQNYIESIEEYKKTVATSAEKFKSSNNATSTQKTQSAQQPAQQAATKQAGMEALGK